MRNKRSCIVFFFLLLHLGINAQIISKKLQTAFQKFESDAQLRNAISSLYVIDAKTGKVVFDKNSTIGLAPASTQKIITAATAYELLGRDYRYKTWIGQTNIFNTGVGQTKIGLSIIGTGDPTLGSWRYSHTKDTVIIEKIINVLKSAGLEQISRLVFYTFQNDLPNGNWIYEDIGNYYGAQAQDFNWHENQYDLTFVPGPQPGDPTTIDTIKTPKRIWQRFANKVTTGTVGSGDNAYIYIGPNSWSRYVVHGTIPSGVKHFTISGVEFDPANSFANAFMDYASSTNFFKGEDMYQQHTLPKYGDSSALGTIMYTHYSPTLDSIIYWFNKKSINLYGEALVKTFAYKKDIDVTTSNGLKLLKDFWTNKGILPTELNMVDGSGLSPLNRVTTHAQVMILKYAKQQNWFSGFYESLPEYNNMKMKSGTIRGVKGFCGYHKSKSGQEYIFSFLVNNYNGSSSSLVQKMYKVLDELK